MKQKKSNKKLVYFAHPISTYKTPEESKALKLINKTFPKHSLFNPATDIKQNGFGFDIMKRCFKIIRTKNTEIIVFMSDERIIGRGVHDEVLLAESLNKKIFYISNGRLNKKYRIKRLNQNSWIRYAKVKEK